jgi:phenylalanyl-tRNA synthetase alpha chain
VEERSSTVAAVDVAALEAEAQSAIAAASTTADLEQARVRFLGRKSDLKQALRQVRDRETGMTLNAVRERLETAFDTREAELERAELDRSLTQDQVDVTLPGEPIRRGRLHPLTLVRREVEDIFLGLGYEVVDGDEVEDTWHLFDALNMPPQHITRSPLHTLYLNGDTVLRTETSPSQIRVMQERQPPVYMISPGRVYRRDTIDATHGAIFHQVEGLAVDRGITLADLKGTLRYVCRALFGADREIRFVTDFFPFTEPSVGVAVSCFLCDGAGCATCKRTGWIELAGSGMVDPNVLRNVGYDPDEVSGFAFGIGQERIALLRHGIPDLRMFLENDLRFLRQF